LAKIQALLVFVWALRVGKNQMCLNVRWLFLHGTQRLAVWLVADYEALTYQVTTTFDTSCAARIPTALAINYTACWQLVFILLRLFINHLALFSSHYQTAPTYPRSTNLFCFFERGQS
jgi:hypothetical protein